MTKIVINDPKEKKSYQVEKEAPSLIGMNIGQNFDGSMIGLGGFTLQIRGGSDKEGFPMRSDVKGPGRKKFLLKGGSGYNPKKKGIKRRKYVRGNQISDAIEQINVKVVEGEGDIPLMLGIKKEEPKEEAKPEEKPAEEKKD